MKRLKESDLVVTQPSNIFGGDFDFIKRYFSKLEKQHVWSGEKGGDVLLGFGKLIYR